MRYLKQVLALIREERLFSGIYIVGTALAIAFTMVMAVVYYIKLAPIYPEPNRARTVYFQGIDIITDNQQWHKIKCPFLDTHGVRKWTINNWSLLLTLDRSHRVCED